MNKILEMIAKGLQGITEINLKGMPLAIIYVFLFLLLLCLILYISAWCVDWYGSGNPKLTLLNQFIGTIVSAPFMAAIGFFAKKVVDKNNDGIPDDNEENKRT